MKHILVYTRTDVYSAEEQLRAAGIDYRIVPTPERMGTFCGLCLRIQDDTVPQAEELLKDILHKIG